MRRRRVLNGGTGHDEGALINVNMNQEAFEFKGL